ncbi:MAG: class I SAM-dependent methyltransferase family protein [Candidatus Freyarchaeota archaeon]|nr:class I SAM-dependent methyltransferase family protein [Candidatus Jordarchaeia archaeon]
MVNITKLLKGVLPERFFKFIPRSFDIVGDIAILELNPEVWGFRDVIGEAILKVNRHVKAVFAKGGRVDGIYRVRRLVHVAGEKRTLTFHRENGCIFKVDVASAYFSPRLSGERVRVANQVKPGETVVDLFAGVGPFAILIAKRRGGIVHAIDINPYAFQLLEENIKLNKVSSLVHPYLGDCREVVNTHLRRLADHVIMNLPSLAYEFIDVACLALRESGGIIHYYQFGRGETACNDVVELFKSRLSESGVALVKILNVKRVRSTSPREWQVAVDALVAP